MNFRNIIDGISFSLLLTISASCLQGCQGMVYEEEGDCNPYYKVRFVYDMNMKFADAFSNEVNEVTLYVIDENDNVVWSRHESGEALKADGYLMDVDVAPGKYTLLAWAGEGHKTHFSVAETSRHRELTCTLDRDYDANGDAHITHDLDRLYHGRVCDLDFPDKQGTHIFKVPLMKNTNDVHVVLQHLSGEPVDPNMFTFSISDNNGKMAHDNSLMDDEQLTYHAWNVSSGTAGVEDTKSGMLTRVQSQLSAAVADLTTARLVENQDARLTVYSKDKGETIISIPLIQYALMVKGHYRDMDNQEYLDRQDDYSMVFFLDSGNRWINSFIYINSWKIVLNDADL